jgi:hypothetical protein
VSARRLIASAGAQAAAGPNRLAALALALGTHLLDLERVPLSIAALTLGHAFVPPEALAALVARHLALQARARPPGGLAGGGRARVAGSALPSESGRVCWPRALSVGPARCVCASVCCRRAQGRSCLTQLPSEWLGRHTPRLTCGGLQSGDAPQFAAMPDCCWTEAALM